MSLIMGNNDYSKVFLALSRRRFDDLLELENKTALLPVLPCLCRTTLYPANVDGVLSDDDRNKLRALLLEFSHTNTLVTFMSVDFPVLEDDLRKDVKLRKKTLNASNGNLESLFSAPSMPGVGHRFETGDAGEKFRLLLSEILTAQLFLAEFKNNRQNQPQPTSSKSRAAPKPTRNLRKFEPLDNEAYLADCADLLVMFIAERPSVISLEELSEVLVHYRNGPVVLRSVILNFPDAWSKVCYYLIAENDFGTTIADDRSPVARKRLEALISLCGLDKFGAADLINHCVEKKKFRLAIQLALRFLPPESITSLVSGALNLAEDQQRSAVTSFVQLAQKDWSILRDVNIPRTVKRSATPRIDSSKSSTVVQERPQFTETDEAIFDMIGQDSDSIVDLRRIRELWEQDFDVQELQETAQRGAGQISPEVLMKALKESSNRPSRAIVTLRHILRSQRGVLTDYIDALTQSLPYLLDPLVPLHVIQLASRLWSKIEVMSPRKLYVLSVAALLPSSSGRSSIGIGRSSWRQRTSHTELCKDPLIILRCNERVFRCAPILNLLLRVLRCYLAASRAHLQRELAAATLANTLRRPGSVVPLSNTQAVEAEREELMRSLVGAQDSAAIQILLEVCLPLAAETAQPSNVTSLREIQCIICAFVHQMFISDPILSKLVHFQTYPSELLPIIVAGIPSMHICLDFIPEMLAQPIQPKRVFAIDLLSCLCEHYAIPKALSLARLAINVLSTLIGVMPGEETIAMISGLLPALLRINRVFPPLSSDIASFLGQVRGICRSRVAASDGIVASYIGAQPWPNLRQLSDSAEAKLLAEINETLRTIFYDSFSVPSP